MEQNNSTLYGWSFPSKTQRWGLWYIIALSCVIGLVIWWFFTKQYILSFLILLITWVYFFIENNSEDEIRVTITRLWIGINNVFYDYARIWFYGMIYQWDHAVILRIHTHKKGVSYIDLKINNDIAINLKEILPQFLQENQQEELSFIDKVVYFLKL